MLRFPSPSLAISITALVISLGGAGYSATGGSFILGATNSANALTRLVASIPSAALRIDNQSNTAGATGLSITTKGGRPPLVINSDVKVTSLNADFLDGINSSQFGRIIAMNSESASRQLALGDNYIFVDSFTPNLPGQCLVTVSTQIGGSTTADLGPYFQLAIRSGGTSENDDFHGDYFLPVGALGYSPAMTRATTFSVSAGRLTRFGVFLGNVPPTWVGNTAEVHMAYLCMTRGTLGLPVSPGAKAIDKQD